MPHRFSPPWSIEESSACFIVRDGDKQAVAYAYLRVSRPSIEREVTHARPSVPYRGEHRKAAKHAASDIEGHSATAEHSRSG